MPALLLVVLVPAGARAQTNIVPTFKPAPPAGQPAPSDPAAPQPTALPDAPTGYVPPPGNPPPVNYPPANYPPGNPSPGNPPPGGPPPGGPTSPYPSPPYPPPPYGQPGYPPPPPSGYPGYPYAPAPYPYGYRPPAHPPGFETHDGVYLRMQLGFGWTGISASTSGSKVDFTGAGGSLGMALGVSLTPHLVLYLSFLEAGSSNPDTKVDGTLGSSSLDGDANVLGVGPGVAYYFVPLNMFVAGTLMTSKVELTDHDSKVLVDSKWGVGFEALFGKEWWVSDNWGLGVTAQMIFARAKGKETITNDPSVPDWRALSLAVLFSATYN